MRILHALMPNRLARVFACKGAAIGSILAVALGVLPIHGLEEPSKSEPSAYRQGTSGVHGILEVDPTSGAASVYIPLGAGIGRPGLCYVPALVGRFAPQVGIAPLAAPFGGLEAAPVLIATTAFELSPGYG